MAKRNFLLGKGERLTEQIRVPSGGGPKIPPYTFSEAKERLSPMLADVADEISRIPSDACPDDLAVALITLNPEYIAKSYHPSELLRNVGLTTIGSRARHLIPKKRSKDREPQESATTELFVIGYRRSFAKWAAEFPNWNEHTTGANQIVGIEEISFPSSPTKIKTSVSDANVNVYEIVLHMEEEAAENRFLKLFQNYLAKLEIISKFERRFYSGGLCFLELEAPAYLEEKIAEFSLVRVLRTMPMLRLLRPSIRTGKNNLGSSIKLPEVPPLDTSIKVAIFDGGIPHDHPICKWATPYEFPDMEAAEEELLEHGVGVTSALLFGPIDPKKPLPQPYSFVDHYRVLDNAPGQNPYELYEVLERISNVLKTKHYDFVNLSLGPCLPIEDDEIHSWTAVLDEHLSNGNTLVTIAVGNDGEGDPTVSANRVQVPADCVNALGIGACDVPDNNWQRAPYSSVGPGRSPGIVKPDLVDFGGSVQRPFLVLSSINGLKLLPIAGTSFAAPSTLRLATGVRAHFGSALNALAIRTLLTHCAESTNISVFEVGWGRISRSLEDIVVCDNHVMRVVFQGKISASKYIRVPIPVPSGPLKGMVSIKATLCYATPVDPHHPDNYTRSGLEVMFRPNKDSRKKTKEGESVSLHAATKNFFGKSQKSYQTEEELRTDAWKWENCVQAENRYQAKSLNEPVFDIHYNARQEGQNDTRRHELQYALVITITATAVDDLYDQVVRRYATQLEQLQPIIDIPIKI